MIRLFDLVLAFFILIGLSPFFILVCCYCWFVTGSPIFKQQRLGRDQKLFVMYKFRTLPVGTISMPTHLLGPVGMTPGIRFLRKYKFDELPQLLNVLLGHMSLVGPRPCLPTQIDLVAERNRLGVFFRRPGLSGLGQILGVDMSTPRKLARIDALMVKRLDICMYFKLLISTFSRRSLSDRVLMKKNR